MLMSRSSLGTDCSRNGRYCWCAAFPRQPFAQAHIRGTLTAAKDGTIGVQTAKGETVSVKLAGDAGLFLGDKGRHERHPVWQVRRHHVCRAGRQARRTRGSCV